MTKPHTSHDSSWHAPPTRPATEAFGTTELTHDCDPAHPDPAAPLCSQALLQGQNAVSIAHNGSIYRLQATRLGKLILTK